MIRHKEIAPLGFGGYFRFPKMKRSLLLIFLKTGASQSLTGMDSLIYTDFKLRVTFTRVTSYRLDLLFTDKTAAPVMYRIIWRVVRVVFADRLFYTVTYFIESNRFSYGDNEPR